MDGKEQIDDIKKKVFRHPNAEELRIKRVPREVVEAFKKFANDKFVGDYGLTLKYLVDNLLIEDTRFVAIWAVINEHEAMLTELSNKPEKKKVRTMLSGREIPVP